MGCLNHMNPVTSSFLQRKSREDPVFFVPEAIVDEAECPGGHTLQVIEVGVEINDANRCSLCDDGAEYCFSFLIKDRTSG